MQTYRFKIIGGGWSKPFAAENMFQAFERVKRIKNALKIKRGLCVSSAE